VVDDVELAAFRKKLPKTAAKLRVLKESERFPCGVIAYLPGGLDDDTLKKLTDGMIEAKSVERGRKFVAAPAGVFMRTADYGNLHALADLEVGLFGGPRIDPYPPRHNQALGAFAAFCESPPCHLKVEP